MRFVRSAAAALGSLLLFGCSQEFRMASSSSGDAESPAPQTWSADADAPGARAARPLAEAGATRSAISALHGEQWPDAAVRPRGTPAGAVASDPGAPDTTTQVDASPEHSRCTSGKAGPLMASIAAADGAAYCIDTTEVTVSDYSAFLATDPPLSLLPSGVCTFKKSFVPEGVFPPSGPAELPVTSVDWCDAAAYCAFAGKHLCGKVGGGANPYSDFAKPASEWYFACSEGGKTTYPYGSTFDPSACVGVDFDGSSGFQPTSDFSHAVATAPKCRGGAPPYDALHDMVGNVAEWEDSCASTGGSADYCHVRGDSYREGNASTTPCGYAPRLTRSYRAAYVGFRCCSEE